MDAPERVFDHSAPAVNGTSLDLLAAELTACRLPPPEERKRIREQAKVPKARAARALGVSDHAFALWERDAVRPRPEHAAAYRKLLELLAQG